MKKRRRFSDDVARGVQGVARDLAIMKMHRARKRVRFIARRMRMSSDEVREIIRRRLHDGVITWLRLGAHCQTGNYVVRAVKP